MDYVVFGIGFGATILVLGLVLRDLGPRVRYRRSEGDDDVLPADKLVAKVAWDRFCRALGTVLAIAGTAFVVATFVCMLFMVSDSTGGWVMAGGLALFFVLILFWTWAYFDRFGSYGILPERPVEEPAGEPGPEVAAANGTTREQGVVGPVPGELPDEDASETAEEPAHDISHELPDDADHQEPETMNAAPLHGPEVPAAEDPQDSATSSGGLLNDEPDESAGGAQQVESPSPEPPGEHDHHLGQEAEVVEGESPGSDVAAEDDAEADEGDSTDSAPKDER